MSHPLPPQVKDMIDSIGEFIEYWGFKNVQGKIWALIFLIEKPIDANFIMNHLEVSKALVSMSIKELLEYDVILKVKSPEKATHHYISNPDLSSVILNVLMIREAKMLLEIKSRCELLDRASENKSDVEKFATKDRVKKLAEMIETADKALKLLTAFKSFNIKDISRSLKI